MFSREASSNSNSASPEMLRLLAEFDEFVPIAPTLDQLVHDIANESFTANGNQLDRVRIEYNPPSAPSNIATRFSFDISHQGQAPNGFARYASVPNPFLRAQEEVRFPSAPELGRRQHSAPNDSAHPFTQGGAWLMQNGQAPDDLFFHLLAAPYQGGVWMSDPSGQQLVPNGFSPMFDPSSLLSAPTTFPDLPAPRRRPRGLSYPLEGSEPRTPTAADRLALNNSPLGLHRGRDTLPTLEIPPPTFWLDNRDWKFRPDATAECLRCDHTLVLPTPGAIGLHDEMVHSEIAPYVCGLDGCTDRFTKLGPRTAHVKTFHKMSENRCSFCLESLQVSRLSFDGALEKHLYSAHRNVKSWKCESCDSAAHNLDALFRHYKDLHSGRADILPQQIKGRFVNRATGALLNPTVQPGPLATVTAHAVAH